MLSKIIVKLTMRNIVSKWRLFKTNQNVIDFCAVPLLDEVNLFILDKVKDATGLYQQLNFTLEYSELQWRKITRASYFGAVLEKKKIKSNCPYPFCTMLISLS